MKINLHQAESDASRKDNILPVCSLCKKVPSGGIRSGFYLKGLFICENCENEIINSKTYNQDDYLYMIARLRRILFNERPQ